MDKLREVTCRVRKATNNWEKDQCAELEEMEHNLFNHYRPRTMCTSSTKRPRSSKRGKPGLSSSVA